MTNIVHYVHSVFLLFDEHRGFGLRLNFCFAFALLCLPLLPLLPNKETGRAHMHSQKQFEY